MTPSELAAALEALDVATVRAVLAASPALANAPVEGREEHTVVALAIVQGRGTQVSDEQLEIVQALSTPVPVSTPNRSRRTRRSVWPPTIATPTLSIG